MANLIRSAKSASRWNMFDLMSYNINVIHKSPHEFFGSPLPGVPEIDPHLISGTSAKQGVSEETDHILCDIDLASSCGVALDDFTRGILRVLGFETCDYRLRSHLNFPFWICDPAGRSHRMAHADVCLTKDLCTILSLVVKSNKDWDDLEARAIASAIAAFQYNYNNKENHISPVNHIIIPCISMWFRRPTFYKVPVTTELSNAVQMGEFPASPTIVERCVVVAHHIPDYWGMELPEYRQLALPHFAAFHTLVKSCWPSFYSK
jgi:hypothetical protein